MFILGWVGIAMGKVCGYIFGWPPWVGLTVFSSICAIYVLAAGYWGVVMADFQQGVIAFLVIIVVSMWGVHTAGGAGAIVDKLQAMGEGGKLNPFNFTGFFAGDFPVAWFITMLFIGILGGFGMGTAIDWYPEAQRIQSARTIKDASWSIWAGSALVLIRNSIWAVAILAFFVIYPDLQDVKDYEMAWFRLGFENLPPGMIGFFFAAIVAIHVSTISTHLNLGAVYITRDLYHHYINPKAKDRQLIWVGRLATLILLLGSFVFGSIMENITEWLIFALWIMAAGVWLPSILQVIWWRFNGWAHLTAWVFNLVSSWLVVWVLPAFGVLPSLKDYQQFWLLMLLGAVVFIPVTFLTKPENMDRLVKFYVMSRPVGWWGPVRREAEKRGLI